MTFGIPEIIGLGSIGYSIFSGAKADSAQDDAIEAQYEYDMAKYEYDIEERDRLYDFTLDQTNITRNNSNNNINYQESLLVNDWKFKEELSIRDQNNQIAAFNKSEQVFGKQVNYNQIAADQAYQENILQLQERTIKGEFDMMKLESQLRAKINDSKYDKAGLENEQIGRRKETAFNKSLRGLQYRSKEAETASSIQNSRLKGMAAEGSLMARGQSGNSIRKGVSSIGVGVGVQQARLLDGLVRADSEWKIGVMKDEQALAISEFSTKNAMNRIDTNVQQAQYDAAIGRNEIDQSIMSAQRSYNSDNLRIANDMFGANLKADAQRRSMPGERIATPKPLALPRPDIQDPYKPGDPPEPIKGAKSGGINTLNALSGAANNLAGLDWGAIFNKP